jgi:hypothetical protein
MGRAERRAEISRFRKATAKGVVSYLIDPADKRLEAEPVLKDALAYWARNISVRRPKCFACRTPFVAEAEAGAFLLLTAPSDARSASISGLCRKCWRDLSDSEIEAAATVAVRPLLRGGRL